MKPVVQTTRRLSFRGSTAILTFTALLALGATASRAQDRFDHTTHDGLFPTCRGCHDPGGMGIYTVGPEDCARCHDDVDLGSVSWTRPERAPSLVRFDHESHPYAVNEPDEDLECATCHAAEGATRAMEVVLPAPGVCLACHADGPEPHWAVGEVACGDCHHPLTEVPLVTAERIAAFPQPETHAAPDFGTSHGALAEEHGEACAVCHARESCERCHANGEQVGAIAALARDERVAGLVAGRAGTWPTPTDHDASWWLAHGSAAREAPERCATCHDAPSCTGCHEQGFARLETLPTVARAGMPVLPLRPLDHTPRFIREHGAMAAARDCGICHDEEAFCVDCHEGQAGGGYHPTNFVLGHAAAAAGPDPECTECHSTEVFCRSCHLERGLSPATQSRANAYHDSEPAWILNHGAAARQGLDECAACHQQLDCLRCHSARSGWRISPHGPDFDPAVLGEASKAVCLACHPQSFLR